MPVESKVVSRAIRSAQTQVEQQNFEIRKDVLKYDDVMNRQRLVIYGERRKVLEGADLHEQIRGMVDEVVAGYAAGETADGYPEEWDLDKLWRAFGQLFPIGMSVDDVVEEAGGDRAGLSGEFITEAVIADAQAAYERREEEFGAEVMRELERRVVLSVLDRKWREHLYEMDYLREGIGLRGYGQRDPLVEYQREGYDMFNAMMEGIKEESVGNLFNLQIQVQENPIVEEAAANGAAPGPVAPATAETPPTQPAVPPQAPVPPQATPGTRPPAARSGGQRGQRTPGAHARSGRPAEPLARPPGARRPEEQSSPLPPGLAPRRARQLNYSAPSVDGGAHVETSRGPAAGDEYAHVGRNDPCPCGSGRKFKRCHGDPRTRQDG